VVAIDDGADSIADIAQQVPSVRHLDRFWRALADPISVRTSAVARDNLNSRGAQPWTGKSFIVPEIMISAPHMPERGPNGTGQSTRP
jgi:hypothetical protein